MEGSTSFAFFARLAMGLLLVSSTPGVTTTATDLGGRPLRFGVLAASVTGAAGSAAVATSEVLVERVLRLGRMKLVGETSRTAQTL